MSGLLGMPRRVYTYSGDMGWDLWNMLSSIGAFCIALSMLVFIANFIYSVMMKRGVVAGPDPWDARTLEWSIPSPPPHYNFGQIPQVHSLDDFWHQKYREDAEGNVLPAMAGAALATEVAHGGDGDGHEEDHHGDIHMPSPSFMPLIAAIGIPIMGIGFIYDYALVPVGATLLIVGVYGWALEPATEED
jgi:cytochrome c oxidase subunit 1